MSKSYLTRRLEIWVEESEREPSPGDVHIDSHIGGLNVNSRYHHCSQQLSVTEYSRYARRNAKILTITSSNQKPYEICIFPNIKTDGLTRDSDTSPRGLNC